MTLVVQDPFEFTQLEFGFTIEGSLSMGSALDIISDDARICREKIGTANFKIHSRLERLAATGTHIASPARWPIWEKFLVRRDEPH